MQLIKFLKNQTRNGSINSTSEKFDLRVELKSVTILESVSNFSYWVKKF